MQLVSARRVRDVSRVDHTDDTLRHSFEPDEAPSAGTGGVSGDRLTPDGLLRLSGADLEPEVGAWLLRQRRGGLQAAGAAGCRSQLGGGTRVVVEACPLH